jgi:hypothetical protein
MDNYNQAIRKYEQYKKEEYEIDLLDNATNGIRKKHLYFSKILEELSYFNTQAIEEFFKSWNCIEFFNNTYYNSSSVEQIETKILNLGIIKHKNQFYYFEKLLTNKLIKPNSEFVKNDELLGKDKQVFATRFSIEEIFSLFNALKIHTLKTLDSISKLETSQTKITDENKIQIEKLNSIFSNSASLFNLLLVSNKFSIMDNNNINNIFEKHNKDRYMQKLFFDNFIKTEEFNLNIDENKQKIFSIGPRSYDYITQKEKIDFNLTFFELEEQNKNKKINIVDPLQNINVSPLIKTHNLEEYNTTELSNYIEYFNINNKISLYLEDTKTLSKIISIIKGFNETEKKYTKNTENEIIESQQKEKEKYLELLKIYLINIYKNIFNNKFKALNTFYLDNNYDSTPHKINLDIINIIEAKSILKEENILNIEEHSFIATAEKYSIIDAKPFKSKEISNNFNLTSNISLVALEPKNIQTYISFLNKIGLFDVFKNALKNNENHPFIKDFFEALRYKEISKQNELVIGILNVLTPKQQKELFNIIICSEDYLNTKNSTIIFSIIKKFPKDVLLNKNILESIAKHQLSNPSLSSYNKDMIVNNIIELLHNETPNEALNKYKKILEQKAKSFLINIDKMEGKTLEEKISFILLQNIPNIIENNKYDNNQKNIFNSIHYITEYLISLEIEMGENIKNKEVYNNLVKINSLIRKNPYLSNHPISNNDNFILNNELKNDNNSKDESFSHYIETIETKSPHKELILDNISEEFLNKYKSTEDLKSIFINNSEDNIIKNLNYFLFNFRNNPTNKKYIEIIMNDIFNDNDDIFNIVKPIILANERIKEDISSIIENNNLKYDNYTFELMGENSTQKQHIIELMNGKNYKEIIDTLDNKNNLKKENKQNKH